MLSDKSGIVSSQSEMGGLLFLVEECRAQPHGHAIYATALVGDLRYRMAANMQLGRRHEFSLGRSLKSNRFMALEAGGIDS